MTQDVYLFFLSRILDPGVKKALDPGSGVRIRNTGPCVLFCTHVVVRISKAWDKLLEVLHDSILELLHLLLHLSAQVPPLLGVFLHTTESVVVKDLDSDIKASIVQSERCYVRALSRLL
jgi:hypothetical protein